MLQLSATLINQPVLSLRTGSPVATATMPIINPNNLKVEGFYCQDDTDHKKQIVLLYQDIRDIIPQGLVINDYDVLSEPHELVRLQEVLALNFDLLGKQVVTTSGDKLGKVTDYATEVTTMFVQKIYVSQSVFKNLLGGNLGIDRTQIVEITSKRIIVHDLAQQVPASANAVA
jgi:uncharacterized protein YrrD